MREEDIVIGAPSSEAVWPATTTVEAPATAEITEEAIVAIGIGVFAGTMAADDTGCGESIVVVGP